MTSLITAKMRTSQAHALLAETLSKKIENHNRVERLWVERCEFLESRGYRLRPRFRPGWVPSWHRTGQNPLYSEDSRFHQVRMSSLVLWPILTSPDLD